MTETRLTRRRGCERLENRIEPWMANRIWWVLVEECGCRDSMWEHYSFICCLSEEGRGFSHEYRFQGALGFGGKFYNNCGRWWVGCYRENRTPERDEMISRANTRIVGLLAEYTGSST